MKSWLLLLLPAMALAQSPKGVQLRGTLRLQRPVERVYISYRTPETAINDSMPLKHGVFLYKAILPEPTLTMLSVRYRDAAADEKREAITFFLQPGMMTVTATGFLKNYTVRGSAAQNDYQLLTAKKKPYSDSLETLSELWSTYSSMNNREAQQELRVRMDSVEVAMREQVYRAFVRNHPQSPIALYALAEYARYDMNPDPVEPLFATLPEAPKQWPSARALKTAIANARKTGVGRIAMDFTQTDTPGVMVSLSQFRGQYVLLDFWASWCIPCRNENPNIVKAFNLYKDKGFTVLGVSLDRPNGKQAWRRAIEFDGLSWTHVSDLMGWNNAVAKQYEIRAIPQNFLIDPRGKIIARNLRGAALEQKLAAVFRENANF